MADSQDVAERSGPKSVLSLTIKDRNALYAAYMPHVRNGGLFIPTTRVYELGDEIQLQLSLMNEAERLPLSAKVVWVTPRGAQGGKVAGMGVQFADNAESRAARSKIEGYLAGSLNSDRSTHTM